jgi:hypothetical protein
MKKPFSAMPLPRRTHIEPTAVPNPVTDADIRAAQIELGQAQGCLRLVVTGVGNARSLSATLRTCALESFRAREAS